jgi:hypothetical protein
MADTSYGIHLSPDLLGGTVQGMDIEKLSRERIREMIDARQEARNAATDLILGGLAITTTDRAALIGQHNEIGEWEDATETGRPRRRKVSGLTGVGYPIYKYEMRSGWSYDYLAKATNMELLNTFEEIMSGHLMGLYKGALRALFSNTAYTWSDTLFQEDGDLAVKPLVGNDADYTPPPWQGNSFDGTHDHHMANGTPFDEADLTLLATEIREHGFGEARSIGGYGGHIEVWIPTNLKSTVIAFTNHIKANDQMVSDINKIWAKVDGDRYLGWNSASKVWIREVPWLPDNYYIGFASTVEKPGQRNAFAPLRRRVPKEAALRGIHRFDDREFPLKDSYWVDFYGFGCYNRISAAVGFVDAGAYAVPDIT